MENYTLENDPIALGLTRPPLFMGVVLQIAVANLFLCALGYIYLQTFWVIPAGSVFHFVAMHLSRKEPRFFMLMWRYFQKTPPVLNQAYWGGYNSYWPG